MRIDQGPPKEIELKGLTIMSRGNRGLKLLKRGRPIAFVPRESTGGQAGSGSSGPPSGGSSPSGKGRAAGSAEGRQADDSAAETKSNKKPGGPNVQLKLV